MHQPPSSTEPVHSRVGHREWIGLVVICLLGVGLRLWRLDHLSIEHFDEGVYAANVYAILDNHCYPARHLYAPPLFPLLCELAIGIGGTPDAAIWVNLLFGSLMVPLVWAVARTGFGPVAAIVSAVLCATSDYHIFFSRSALTDVSLCFWLLLSVWLACRGMYSGNGLTLGGAAVAAALGWWTKYNGWLAIAIPLGGWGLLAIISFLKQRSIPIRSRLAGVDREGLFRWGVFAILAALFWSPVVYDLQAVGGYSAVSANHARYLVGLAGWWDGLRMHMAFHGWLTTGIGIVTSVVCLLLWLPRERRWGLCGALLCLIPMAFLSGIGVGLGVISGVTVLWIVRNWCRESEPSAQSPRPGAQLLDAMLVTWWVGLTLTTPLYTPYARLSLPWLVASWMLIGRGSTLISRTATVRHYAIAGVAMFFFAVCLGDFLGTPRETSLDHVWGDRTALRKSTLQILHETDMGRREMPPSESAECEYAIYVVGEPALFCHLSQLSDDTVIMKPAATVTEAAAPHRTGPAFPKFIVTGSHTPRSEIDQALAAQQIELIWEQQVLISNMVSLDSASRLQLQATHLKSIRPPEKTMPIRVFRILE